MNPDVYFKHQHSKISFKSFHNTDWSSEMFPSFYGQPGEALWVTALLVSMTAELRAGAAGSMVGQPSGEQKHSLMRRAEAHTCLIRLIELEAANPGGSFLLELFPASTALMLHHQCGRSGEDGLKSLSGISWLQLLATSSAGSLHLCSHMLEQGEEPGESYQRP